MLGAANRFLLGDKDFWAEWYAGFGEFGILATVYTFLLDDEDA